MAEQSITDRIKSAWERDQADARKAADDADRNDARIAKNARAVYGRAKSHVQRTVRRPSSSGRSSGRR